MQHIPQNNKRFPSTFPNFMMPSTMPAMPKRDAAQAVEYPGASNLENMVEPGLGEFSDGGDNTCLLRGFC